MLTFKKHLTLKQVPRFESVEIKDYISFRHNETRSIAEASLVDGEDFGITGKVYFFNRLLSGKPGQGGGTIVLKQLLEYIDKIGIPLLDQVNAYGNLSQKQLILYYKKFGFVPFNKKKYGDNVLIYYPKGPLHAT